jgi:hypothetical protein
VADCWSRVRRLKTDFVVDRVSEPLLAPEVPFRCLNADVTQQELNLFKLPACLMTQTGAGTTKIVRRNPIQTTLLISRRCAHRRTVEASGKCVESLQCGAACSAESPAAIRSQDCCRQ